MRYHLQVIIGLAVIGFLALVTLSELEERRLVDENTSMIGGVMVAVVLMGAFSVGRGGKK